MRPNLGPVLRGERVSFDAIVFPKTDRASRETLDGLILLKWAQENGKRLIILEPYMDSSTMTPAERMHFVMGLEMGSYERAQTIQRVRIGVASGRLKARYLGGKIPLWLKVVPHPTEDEAFAYDVDEEKLVLVLALVQRVRSRLPDGRRMPYGTICRELDDKGIPTPDLLRNTTRPNRKRKPRTNKAGVKRWTPAGLIELLSNRLLIGQREVVKYQYTNGKRGKEISREVVRDEAGRPVEYCPATIEYDVWLELQDIFSTPRRKTPIQNRTELQGVVCCIACRETCYIQRAPNRAGERVYRYFVCSNRTRYRTCEMKSVREERVLEYLELEMVSLAGDLEVFERIEPPRQDYTAKLAGLRDEVEGLKRLFRVTKSESGIAKLESQIGALDGEIAELEIRESNPPEATYIPTGKVFLDMWRDASWHQRGDLLRSVGISVDVGTMDGAPRLEIRLPEDFRDRLRLVTGGGIPSPLLLPNSTRVQEDNTTRRAMLDGVSAPTPNQT